MARESKSKSPKKKPDKKRKSPVTATSDRIPGPTPPLYSHGALVHSDPLGAMLLTFYMLVPTVDSDSKVESGLVPDPGLTVALPPGAVNLLLYEIGSYLGSTGQDESEAIDWLKRGIHGE